jgi:hypothetical protein
VGPPRQYDRAFGCGTDCTFGVDCAYNVANMDQSCADLPGCVPAVPAGVLRRECPSRRNANLQTCSSASSSSAASSSVPTSYFILCRTALLVARARKRTRSRQHEVLLCWTLSLLLISRDDAGVGRAFLFVLVLPLLLLQLLSYSNS